MRYPRTTTRRVLAVFCGLPLTVASLGCANNAKTGALIGTGLGAATGAVVGNQSGEAGEGAAIGAAVGAGAGAGYIIGNEQDKAERERHRRDGATRR